MVEEIVQIVTEYEQRLRRSSHATRLSYQRPIKLDLFCFFFLFDGICGSITFD